LPPWGTTAYGVWWLSAQAPPTRTAKAAAAREAAAREADEVSPQA
jgi:hypothetical protein